MDAPCSQKECTVLQTGRCLLENDPATCPNRHAGDATTADDIAGQLRPALTQPPAKPKFPASLTLSLEDAAIISSRRYATVVGILGLPDAGKTAAIVSLYLLL